MPVRRLSTEPIPRLVATVSTAILAIRYPPHLVHCLATATGQGEERVGPAIRLWQQSYIPSLTENLIVSGFNVEEPAMLEHMGGLHHYTLDRLQECHGLTKTTGVLIDTNHRANTREQMDGVVDLIMPLLKKRPNLTVGLNVVPYHLPRAYLTLLKCLTKRGLVIPLIPLPIQVDMFSTVCPQASRDEGRIIMMDEMVAGEARRIAEYQAKGDVANYGEAAAYLMWLCKWMTEHTNTF